MDGFLRAIHEFVFSVFPLLGCVSSIPPPAAYFFPDSLWHAAELLLWLRPDVNFAI